MGAKLAAVGCNVSVVARGAALDALRAHGLRLREGDAETTCPVQASDDPAALGVQDLVVVSVKAPGMADVARRIGPLIGPRTLVLTAMNGVPWWFLQGFGGPVAGRTLESVDPGGAIAQAIPAAQVI
ncbi:MAG: 2-dehydropantoate 2-reductase, partial [Ottowia sp.]|nr:2-dehydropantoate 2-reductase [Ottowia sp.]